MGFFKCLKECICKSLCSSQKNKEATQKISEKRAFVLLMLLLTDEDTLNRASAYEAYLGVFKDNSSIKEFDSLLQAEIKILSFITEKELKPKYIKELLKGFYITTEKQVAMFLELSKFHSKEKCEEPLNTVYFILSDISE